MQIENDYDKDVYKGDIGYLDAVDPDVGELVARFDGRAVTYGFGELDMLVPAYAATIHKSQGSEYPAVVIPIMTQHYAMLQRNLLYTEVTRGKSWLCWSGRRGLSPSPSEMSRADAGGRSCRSGSAPIYLYRGRSAWRAEPWALNISLPHWFGISNVPVRIESTEVKRPTNDTFLPT